MMAKWRRFIVGTGKARAGYVGLLDTSNISIAGVSPSATGSDKVLLQAILKGRALNKTPTGLYILGFGTFAANGNTKTLKAWLGASAVTGFTIFSSGAITTNGNGWILEAMVWRSGSKTQIGVGQLSIQAAAPPVVSVSTAGTQDDTVDLVVSLSANCATATTDVVCNGLIVESMNL